MHITRCERRTATKACARIVVGKRTKGCGRSNVAKARKLTVLSKIRKYALKIRQLTVLSEIGANFERGSEFCDGSNASHYFLLFLLLFLLPQLHTAA